MCDGDQKIMVKINGSVAAKCGWAPVFLFTVYYQYFFLKYADITCYYSGFETYIDIPKRREKKA